MARIDSLRKLLLAALTSLMLLASDHSLAQSTENSDAGSAAAAAQIAGFFSTVGDQIYDECIFELSQEQIEVQQALIQAYINKGASGLVARQLAVKQIQPPKLSERCSSKLVHHALGHKKAGYRSGGQTEPGTTGVSNRAHKEESLASVGLRARCRLCHHSTQRL
jgi:hypothetical protein